MYRRFNKYCCSNCNNNYSNCDEFSDLLENKCDNYQDVNNCNDDDCDCNCGCGFDEHISAFPDNAVLAQSYVPYQYMDKTFKPCVGLKMGTIFPELVSPYVPCQGIEEIEFIKATNKIGKGCNR